MNDQLRHDIHWMCSDSGLGTLRWPTSFRAGAGVLQGCRGTSGAIIEALQANLPRLQSDSWIDRCVGCGGSAGLRSPVRPPSPLGFQPGTMRGSICAVRDPGRGTHATGPGSDQSPNHAPLANPDHPATKIPHLGLVRDPHRVSIPQVPSDGLMD